MRRLEHALLFAAAIGVLAVGHASADTLPVDADTYARVNPRDADPLEPAGDAAFVHVRSGRSGAVFNGYARFDLSALPALPPGAAIEKATVRLWVSDVAAEGAIQIAPLLDPWDEGTLSPAGLPAMGQFTASILATAADVRRYVSTDVTDLVQEWVSGALANHGIALVGDPGGVAVQFSSKENAAGGHPMELEVVITSAGPAGPRGPAGPQGPEGPQGPAGLLGVSRHITSRTLLPGDGFSATYSCPQGKQVLSGGILPTWGGIWSLRVVGSGPVGTKHWYFAVDNEAGAGAEQAWVDLVLTCAEQ